MNLIFCPRCASAYVHLRIEGDYECEECGERFLEKKDETLLTELKRQSAILKKLIHLLKRTRGGAGG